MVLANECTEFIAAASVSPLVHDELERDRRFHPNLGGVTRGGLANHFPMTLLALHGLGASDEEFRAFIRAWPRHRASLDDGALGLADRGAITAESWPAFLGRSAYLLEFRRLFEEALASPEGLGVVTRALAEMRDGLPMGLFHPLIRLSFALAHGDRGLIADALAYMAIRHFDLFRGELPRPDAGAPSRSAASVWKELRPAEATSRLIASLGGASLRIGEQLCADRALREAALPPGFAIAPAEIASLALRLYVDTPSLTTLHAVTAAHALAEIDRRLGPDAPGVLRDLWARYWIWLTGLYLEKGRPPEPPVVAAPRESWAELSARARAIPEVHLIKMAYSCRWLDEAFGPDPRYKVAVLEMLAATS